MAKITTIRILIALTAKFGWKLQQFDVDNVFLHRDLEEDVFMEIPPSFQHKGDGKNQVYKLKKFLYGLKQSPPALFGRFSAMLSIRYHQSWGDHTLFIKHQGEKATTLLVYVDDIVVTGNDIVEQGCLKHNLAWEFEIKDLGQLRYFLGIEVAHSKEGIFLSQRQYVLDLLDETSLLGEKRGRILVDPNTKLQANKGGQELDNGRLQRLVGRLIYLAHTRPNISFDVNLVSQFMHDPNEKHMATIRKILYYLKATPGKGILCTPGTDLRLQGYTDVDYGVL